MTTDQSNAKVSGIILAYFGALCPLAMSIMNPFLGASAFARQLAFESTEVLLVVVTLMAILVFFFIKPQENNPDGTVKEQPTTIPTIAITFVIFAILFGFVFYVHDRVENPPESFCREVNDEHGFLSGVDKQAALNLGKCIRNETGFHANGKAVFPS